MEAPRTRSIINPNGENVPTLKTGIYYPSSDTWNWNYYYGFYNTRFGRGNKYCLDHINRGMITNPLFIDDQTRVLWVPLQNVTHREKIVSGSKRAIDGGWTCSSRPVGSPSDFSESELEDQVERLDGDGGTAWARFRPNKPNASLGQTIAEISSLPKMLKSTALIFHTLWKSMGGKRKIADTSKAVADEWLNNQFGWKPFLSDCRGFIHTTHNLSDEIARVRQENGNYQFVGGTVTNSSEEETLSSSNTATYHYPTAIGSIWLSSPYGSYVAKVRTTEKSWFKAKMKYYIPSFSLPGWRGDLAIASHLYGLRITPTLLYEIMPWSWLIDWFTNVGSQIQNWESIYLDGLHAKYACIMQTISRGVYIDSTLNLSGGAVSCTFAEEQVIKRRSSAMSPFGWAVDKNSLSNWQKSILGAIGLSKLRF